MRLKLLVQRYAELETQKSANALTYYLYGGLVIKSFPNSKLLKRYALEYKHQIAKLIFQPKTKDHRLAAA